MANKFYASYVNEPWESPRWAVFIDLPDVGPLAVTRGRHSGRVEFDDEEQAVAYAEKLSSGLSPADIS